MVSDKDELKEVYQEMADLGLENPKGHRSFQQIADSYGSAAKPEPKKDNNGRFWQIDFLKAFSIALVILDHSTTHNQNFALASPLWQRIAIPIFMVVLGFNWAKSLNQKRHLPYYKLFSWRHYWRNKIVRFLLPYAIIYLLSTILFFAFERQVPAFFPWADPWFRYIGFTPVYGPGLWFIPTLFLTIIVFPFIYVLFDCFNRIRGLKKVPIIGSLLALIICFGIEIGITMLFYDYVFIVGIPIYSLLFTPLSLMVGIGLGIFLSQNHKISALRNIVIWILGLISLIIIIVYTFVSDPLSISSPWIQQIAIFADNLLDWGLGDYFFAFTPYSALLVFLFLNILPKDPKGKFGKFIRLISKSTYHILMVQIFYFMIIYTYFLDMNGIWGTVLRHGSYLPMWANYVWYPINLAITFTLGVLWYKLENQLLWNNIKTVDKRRLERVKSMKL